MPFAIGLREHSPLGAVLNFGLANKEILGDRAQEQKSYSCNGSGSFLDQVKDSFSSRNV